MSNKNITMPYPYDCPKCGHTVMSLKEAHEHQCEPHYLCCTCDFIGESLEDFDDHNCEDWD